MEAASRLPAIGLKYLMDVLAIELRNLEALGFAQQKLIEGIGALLRHQTEMVGGALRRLLDAKALAGSLPADTGAALLAQVTAFKASIEESRANSNILSEVAARNILHVRTLAALDELKAALEAMVEGAPAAVPPALTVQPTPVA